jgi:FAD binding domain
MSTTDVVPTRAPSEPPAELVGKYFNPDNPDFEQARRAWNLAVDQRPAVVVYPESAQDVAAAIRYAAAHGLRVTAQGTGHLAGPLGVLDDTVLLKTERMRGVQIDPSRRIARIEAGVLSRELVAAAAVHGLAGLAGSAPDVSVVGYTLGGGLPLIGRSSGLCANWVRAIELVTADGNLLRCDQEHKPDLFWALRGGGGSFGIVTALELELVPLQHAYAGALFYPIERGGEALHAWRELTHSNALPDALTTMGRYLRLPPVPHIPEPLRGKSFAVVHVYHVGEPVEADDLLAPLRALKPVQDTIRSVPIQTLTDLHLDPPQPVPAAGDGLLLAELPANALDAFVEIAGEDANPPLVTVELRHLGGQLGRSQPNGGALSAFDAEYSLYAAGIVPARDLEAPVRARIRAIQAALGPWAAPRAYLNFTETRGRVSSFWDEQTFQRLRHIKADVDPHDVIRANHPVPPAHRPQSDHTQPHERQS